MAFKTFVSGDVLTAAEMNDYLMEQAVIACTSGTRPSSPNEGMTIYETDTDDLNIYNGSGWYPPWNLPWGFVSFESTVADTNIGTGATTVETYTGTHAVGRRLKFECNIAYVYQSSGATSVALTSSTTNLSLDEGLGYTTLYFGTGTGGGMWSSVHEVTGASVTFNLRVAANTGSLQCGDRQIVVYDVGPA